MVGDFNISKFLTENKVTIASQRLSEIELGPIVGSDGKPMGGLAASGSAGMGSFGPGIKTELDATSRPGTDRLDEFEALLKEYEEVKAKLDEVEKRRKDMIDVLKPMFVEMKELGENLATIEGSEKMIFIKKHGFDRVQPDYKSAFENGLTKVNAVTRAVLEECLAIANAAKKPSYIAPQFSINKQGVNEGVLDKIKSVFSKAVAKFVNTADKAAKVTEDFINFLADNVPGGEDVDDTPNPVLEAEKALKGGQKKLDKDGDGKITGKDFKMLKKEDAPKMPPMPQSTGNKPNIPAVPPVPGKKPAMPPVPSSLDKINLKPANADVTNPATFAKTLYDMAKKLISGEAKGFNPEADANIKIAMNALRKAAKIPTLPENSLEEGLNEDFKVGDTVSNPEELGHGAEFDGKILGVFPNLEAAKDTAPKEYQRTIKSLSKPENSNDTWYLINWKTEGNILHPKSEVDKMVIASDNRNFDDYGDDVEYDASIHNPR